MAKGQGKKSPSAIKKLKGTYNKSRELNNEMMPPTVNEVRKPETLINKFADDEWIKVTGVLSSLGMLHETDTSLLLAYCNEIGVYFDCITKVKATGYTQESKANGEVISSFMKVGNTALQNAIKLSDKFGFNPAARTKIEMPEKKSSDPFEDL